MRWILIAATAGVLLASTLASAEEYGPVEVRRIPSVLPTADEIANPHLYRPQIPFDYVVPSPSWAPPPPAGSVRPGEFDPMDSTIITIVDYGPEFTEMWVTMVETFAQAGHTWIISTPETKESFSGALEQAGVSADAYSFLHYPVDSIWIRDYGPEFPVAPDGTRYIFDAYYAGRPLDDVIPILIGGSDWINTDGTPIEVNSNEHGLSGGNVFTDGAGTCFFSNIVYGYEKPGGWTDEDVDALMSEYLGCEQMIILRPICNDMTGHIDLYAKAMGPLSILLGEFPPDTFFHGTEDAGTTGHCGDSTPDDYQDQEDNLATLEASTNLNDEAFVITRIPELEPYTDGGWVYRSYLNSEMMNNYVAMPSYYAESGPETAEELLDLEAQAIAAYEAALPGVNVVPIDADHIIAWGGAMHCISHEIPQEAGGGWVAPDEYCGDGVVNGDEECDSGDFGGTTCEDLGHGPGDYLVCAPDCTIDDSECPSANCGDGVLDDDEECDPCDPNPPTCADYGLGTGNLGCNLDCSLNTINCTEASACEAIAALDEGVVCCPDPPPADCAAGSWDWSDESSYYGCCTADMAHMIWCGDSYNDWNCNPGICGYVPSGPYVDCTEDELPEPAEEWPEFCGDLPGQDAGPDGGTGGGDDGCGCSAAGSSRLFGLLGLLLTWLFG